MSINSPKVSSKIKVLHLWKSDSVAAGGGGAGAMYSLHCALRNLGVESKILCEIKTTDSPYVSVLPRKSISERLIKRVTSRLGLNDIHRISSSKIKQLEIYKEADIINFHGIHSGFLSYLALPRLTRDKPAVFTLHDMWPLTGHCAQSYDCNRWETGCGKCPYPQAYPPVSMDNTRLEWRLKRWAYNHSSFSVVAPSKWLTGLARESMLNHLPIHLIPNGINCEVFSPLESEKFRPMLEIPPDKKVLMFAASSLKDPGKGGDLLLEALKSLPAGLKSKTCLLTMGNQGEGVESAVGMKTVNLGFITSERLKAIAYSIADVFVSPTRAESFGLVIAEGMACGTPSVSFKVGGVTDLVRPGITGYLAEPEDAKDLRNGIIQLLEDDSARNSMSLRCREIALKEYTLELQAQRYIELYSQLLRERR